MIKRSAIMALLGVATGVVARHHVHSESHSEDHYAPMYTEETMKEVTDLSEIQV